MAGKRKTTAKSSPAKRPLATTSKFASLERVYVRDRAQWRAWLETNHATSAGIWLIFDKKSAGRERLPYGDAVEEALCFGWIDSLARPIDEAQYQQLFTPRKPTSVWSRPNKERVERLRAAGLLRPAGIAAIEIAQRNGSWSSRDAADALEIPPDLAEALARARKARRNFEAFPPSSQRAYLYWVSSAKRPETREKRIRAVVDLALRNQKTPKPVGKSASSGRGPS
jgi:uncharacterized protein YdeI (YjbR/CyaY-like superfamily)